MLSTCVILSRTIDEGMWQCIVKGYNIDEERQLFDWAIAIVRRLVDMFLFGGDGMDILTGQKWVALVQTQLRYARLRSFVSTPTNR